MIKHLRRETEIKSNRDRKTERKKTERDGIISTFNISKRKLRQLIYIFSDFILSAYVL